MKSQLLKAVGLVALLFAVPASAQNPGITFGSGTVQADYLKIDANSFKLPAGTPTPGQVLTTGDPTVTDLEWKTILAFPFQGTTAVTDDYGLDITSIKPASAYAILATNVAAASNVTTAGALKVVGNVDLYSDGTNAYPLRFWNPAHTKFSSFTAGVQANDIQYTLPITAPVANGYVLSSTTTGTLSWAPLAVSSFTYLLVDDIANPGDAGETFWLVTDGTGGNLSIPSAVDVGPGGFLFVKIFNGGAGATLVPAGGMIEGAGNYAGASGEAIRLISDGTDWWLL